MKNKPPKFNMYQSKTKYLFFDQVMVVFLINIHKP